MSRKIQLLAGILLTVFFLWILARNVSPEELSEAFQGADYSLVIPAALATFFGYLLRTLRWQRIVRPVAPLKFSDSFAVLMMGFAANNLLPARLGELVRAFLLGRKTGVRKTYGMATIVLERVCDGMVLIGFLGIVSLLMPMPSWGKDDQMISGILWISSALFIGASLGIVVLLVQENLTMRLMALALKPLPDRMGAALLRATKTFISGMHSLRSRKSLAIVIALSLGVWLLEASSYLLMTRSFGVWMANSTQLLAAVFLLVVINLGIMVPSAPGYVGTFQFFGVMALGVFGVSKETALAIAISSHLMQYLLVTAIGLIFFAKENLAFWRFEEISAQETDADDAITQVSK
ncbi:MAG: lysylphosphatidylglycerol synthase transmembrane domain-containing protein [Chloroflexota bacterium]